MEPIPPCPSCGKPLAPNAPQGLCPECLMKGAFQTGTAAVSGDAAEAKPPRFVPPAVEDLARHFPQLEILKFIGQGGMGAVYQARQKELDRIVALKILPPQVAGGAGFAERFTQEARAMGKLNHPHIVTLYQFGQADGLFYFLMEFVDGITLQQLLQSGRIAPREALAIVPQICDALQYAHQRGIVHRDIKPGNILLSKEGWVKIADFGVAKIVAEGLEETGANTGAKSGELTGAGSVLGTPQYMAPEQVARPQEVDHRADIYSLGVVFYEMLTGELPAGKLAPPSSRVRGLQIDVRLDEVVLRALEKQPDLRYQEAGTMKTVVETIATTPPVQPGASAPKPGAAFPQPANPGGPLPTGAFAGPGLRRTIKWVALGVAVMAVLAFMGIVSVIWFVNSFHRRSFPFFTRASASWQTPAQVVWSAPVIEPPPQAENVVPNELPSAPALFNNSGHIAPGTLLVLDQTRSNLERAAKDGVIASDQLQDAMGQLGMKLKGDPLLSSQSNLTGLFAALEGQMAVLTNSMASSTNYDSAKSAAEQAQASLRKLQAEMSKLASSIKQTSGTPLKAGDLAMRFDAAQSINNFMERDDALASVAKDAARVGDAGMVRKSLEKIANFMRRDEVAGDAARLLVKRGQRNDAIQVAKTISNFTTRDQVLAELAR